MSSSLRISELTPTKALRKDFQTNFLNKISKLFQIKYILFKIYVN